MVTEIAREIVGTLKGQPAVLGLLLVVFALLGFSFYARADEAKFRQVMIAQMFELQKRVAECSPRVQ